MGMMVVWENFIRGQNGMHKERVFVPPTEKLLISPQ